jgi:hypothetical protein
MKVKTLRDSVNLDLDNNLYGDRIFEEIVFIAVTIGKIFTALKNSSFITNRLEYLKSLQRLKRQFVSLLDSLLSGTASYSGFPAEHMDRLKRISESYQTDIEEIREMISTLSGESREDEYIISREEYKYLLSDSESTPA